MRDDNGCSKPFAFAFCFMLAIYGIRAEVSHGSGLDRALNMLWFTAPLLALLGCTFIPRLLKTWKETKSKRKQKLEMEERESQMRADALRRERRNDEKMLREAEKQERDRQRAAERAELKRQDAARAAALEEEKKQLQKQEAWILKSARLECERQFEVFRPLLRKDFTEARFQNLLVSHLGSDCPADELEQNKEEVLQMITMLVGEPLDSNEPKVNYNDARSATIYFQREIDRIKDMEIDEEDKEMLIALVKKRRYMVIDRLINDDANNS